MRGEGLKDAFEGPDLNKQVVDETGKTWGPWGGGHPFGEFKSSVCLSVWCLLTSKWRGQVGSWRKYSRRDG